MQVYHLHKVDVNQRHKLDANILSLQYRCKCRNPHVLVARPVWSTTSKTLQVMSVGSTSSKATFKASQSSKKTYRLWMLKLCCRFVCTLVNPVDPFSSKTSSHSPSTTTATGPPTYIDAHIRRHSMQRTKCTNLKEEEATWVLPMDKKPFDPSECRQPSFIWVFLVVYFDDTVVELEVLAIVDSAERGVVDGASLDCACRWRHLQPVLLLIRENTSIFVCTLQLVNNTIVSNWQLPFARDMILSDLSTITFPQLIVCVEPGSVQVLQNSVLGT